MTASAWPDVGIKSNPNFPIDAQKFFHQKLYTPTSFKKLPDIWANFKVTFVTKNFQKSANLVTLDSIFSFLTLSLNVFTIEYGLYGFYLSLSNKINDI